MKSFFAPGGNGQRVKAGCPACLANQIVLTQGLELLPSLGKEDYTGQIPSCFNSSIGSQMRHILEHYELFMRSLSGAKLCYSDRSRNRTIETDPSYAARLIQIILRELDHLSGKGNEPQITYVSECIPDVSVATTIIRELEFLLSHTVHHYAIIAIICRLRGIEIDPILGVAPSTLAYKQTAENCESTNGHKVKP